MDHFSWTESTVISIQIEITVLNYKSISVVDHSLVDTVSEEEGGRSEEDAEVVGEDVVETVLAADSLILRWREGITVVEWSIAYNHVVDRGESDAIENSRDEWENEGTADIISQYVFSFPYVFQYLVWISLAMKTPLNVFPVF